MHILLSLKVPLGALLMITVACLNGTPATAPSNAWPVPDYAAIVQADVVNITDSGTSFLVTLQVRHVYCGSVIAEGGTFQTGARKTPEESAPAGVFPVPKMGERGLWFVGRTRDGKCFGNERAPEPLSVFPARQGIDAHYAAAEQLADLIESVCRAPFEKRVELLRKSAADQEGIVAAWAVRYLAKISIDEVVRLAKSVTVGDSKLGIAGQVAIDTALSEDWRAEWMKSPDRSALLNGWATRQSADTNDALSIACRLDWASQNPALADATIVKALETASLNRAFTEESRRLCIRAIGVLATRNPNRTDLGATLQRIETTAETKRLRSEAGLWRDKLK